MKIESIIRRKNGTRVELDDQVYHFKPTPEDERHLAEVSIRAHIQRFLSIPEGFQPAEIDETQASPAPAPVQQPPAPPVQASPLNTDQPVLGTLAGVQNKDGSVSTLPQLPREQLLVLARDMEIEGAEDLSDEELVKAIEADPVELVDDADADSEADTGNGDETKGDDKAAEQPAPLDREALVEQYKARFKKAPHHKLTAERIKQILDEDEGE
ncbi:hypothetical protein [Pseudomonas phage Itty13]|uniref:Uncharacterized protein n=1 Tax=Pseudomonas phage Itty13 TaxID=2805750 RepID=A0A889IQY5_9CAUD|nr:hypothetical protein PQC19_gp19 [Pseudomonas phage Itty13]QRE00595.1 hypothetical protein [Pseudomonas phage Itty13]